MSTTVAIVNWNSGKLLQTCLESLLATPTPAEILVVDNASGDESLKEALGFRDRVNFVRNSVNRGLAAAVNQAFAASTTPYVLLLNPDICVTEGAVSLLQAFMEARPEAGAVGGYVNEKYLPRKFPTVRTLVRENLGFSAPPRPHDRKAEAVPVDQPAGAALMIRRDAYDEVGGFDEQFYPAWYEDVDFCRRLAKAGWKIYFAPRAEFLHEGGYSAQALGTDKFVRAYYGNQLRYVRKHMSAAAGAVVRASIAAGMLGRIIARPNRAKAYGKVLLGVISEW